MKNVLLFLVLFSLFLFNACKKDDSNPLTPVPASITYAGKTYNTVQIGNQIWLKENLNVGTMINSTAGGFQQTNSYIIEKYCYDNNPANCDTFGGLYEWPEAMQYVTTPGTQGICPTGWHIPTRAEFEALKAAVNNDSKSLKSIGQGTGSGVGTNTSGFSALLSGYRDTGSSLSGLGYATHFWSSSEFSSNDAVSLGLSYDDSLIGLPNYLKEYGNSIRCVKD